MANEEERILIFRGDKDEMDNLCKELPPKYFVEAKNVDYPYSGLVNKIADTLYLYDGAQNKEKHLHESMISVVKFLYKCRARAVLAALFEVEEHGK